MPFVIDTAGGKPVKYPPQQWCELQAQFNGWRTWEDDGTCRICGSTYQIIGHHTNYKKETIIPICRTCHTMIHNDWNHPLHPKEPMPHKRSRPCSICGKKLASVGKDWINGTLLWMCSKCFDTLTPANHRIGDWGR